MSSANKIFTVISFFVVGVSFAAPNGSGFIPSGYPDIDASIKLCKEQKDNAKSRGACAHAAYAKADLGSIFGAGNCILTEGKPPRISDINGCQIEVAKLLANAAAPLAIPLEAQSIQKPATQTTGTAVSALDDVAIGSPPAAIRPATHLVVAEKPTDWSFYALVGLAALSVLSTVIAVVAIVKSKRLEKNIAETYRSTNDDIKVQQSASISQLNNEIAVLKTDLKKIQGQPVIVRADPTRAAQALPVRQPAPQSAVPRVATTPVPITLDMAGLSLTAAVQAFVKSNVAMSPVQAFDQILKYVDDDSVVRWMRDHDFAHYLLDPDGEQKSNGQLVAFGAVSLNTWFVFPRPLSENVPRFSLWFDGDVSMRNVVARRSAVATMSHGGRFDIKEKGLLG